MKNLLSRFSVVCVATVLLVAVRGEMNAQPAAEPASSRVTSPQDLGQAELLRAYLQLREQLHATQLTVASNRAEAEAAARVQTATLSEKLESLKLALESERARQQADRERQQLAAQESNRTLLWIAGSFGAFGLAALLVLPFVHLRAINRIVERTTLRASLPALPAQQLLGAEGAVAADQAVAGSNQRLLSVIDRLERRVVELEHTAASPLPGAPVKPAASDPITLKVTPVQANVATTSADGDSRRAAAANAQATWIEVLTSKARSLLASNKPLEAVACYDEILKLDGKHSDALVKKGAALERLNRWEEAIECYDRAIATDQRMTLAYVRKGAACSRLGRQTEAVECLAQATRAEEAVLKTAVHA